MNKTQFSQSRGDNSFSTISFLRQKPIYYKKYISNCNVSRTGRESPRPLNTHTRISNSSSSSSSSSISSDLARSSPRYQRRSSRFVCYIMDFSRHEIVVISNIDALPRDETSSLVSRRHCRVIFHGQYTVLTVN